MITIQWRVTCMVVDSVEIVPITITDISYGEVFSKFVDRLKELPTKTGIDFLGCNIEEEAPTTEHAQ